jgi:hypothetical protein
VMFCSIEAELQRPSPSKTSGSGQMKAAVIGANAS